MAVGRVLRRPGLPPRRPAGCIVAAAAALLLPALRFGGGPSRDLAAPRAFAAPAGAPSEDDLLKALGRELWVIGDELLTVSARIKTGASLGTGGISLRNAADLMIDGNWEDVMGELETAAFSCDYFIPSDRFEGLVNLFSYYEPMPEWEWMSARNSLLGLSSAIRDSQMDMLRDLSGAYRMETSESIDFMVERLKKSAKLFEPGGFYMPPQDPRDKVNREGRGAPRMPEARPFRSARGPQNEAAFRAKLMQDKLRAEAQTAAEAAGNGAVVLLQRVDGELEAAASAPSPYAARRSALRRMLRELHPDRNPTKQADVRPVFEYIVKLRDEEK